ncbi:MAG: hypothetical protein ACI9QC_000144 [Oceanicoccus sp.]|jgi:hypothetical protein
MESPKYTSEIPSQTYLYPQEIGGQIMVRNKNGLELFSLETFEGGTRLKLLTNTFQEIAVISSRYKIVRDSTHGIDIHIQILRNQIRIDAPQDHHVKLTPLFEIDPSSRVSTSGKDVLSFQEGVRKILGFDTLS